MNINITYFDQEGNEIAASLPGKNEVCSKCEGHGTHLNPSIGEHAYSAEEFYDSFPEEEDREQYFQRGGIYDVPCEKCHGKNVILVVDEDACTTSAQKAHLEAYNKYQDQVAQDREEDARTSYYESGGMYGHS